MDWSDYEDMRERRHPAAWLWRVGYNIILVGCLPALLGLAAAVFMIVLAIFGVIRWSFLADAALVGVVASVGWGILFMGSGLQNWAMWWAERDGIAFRCQASPEDRTRVVPPE